MNVLYKLFHPRDLLFTVGIRGGLRFLNDENYLKLMYCCRFGKKLSLDAPENFNEKIQWLKLNDHNSLYTRLADKYEVKQYVTDKLGKEYVIPTIGVWDSLNDIDFDMLPEQFVLKCTHDSGGLVICRDKSSLNREIAYKKISRSLRRNYYWAGREYPYKEIKPRIIAERYLEDETGCGLRDYKFYCFSGVPKFLYISEGLENHKTAHISFLKISWEKETFQRSDFLPFETIPKKPDNFDEMIEIAKKLSEGFPFMRVDLYSISGRVYFSEMTLYPCSGFMLFLPDTADKEIGSYLRLKV